MKSFNLFVEEDGLYISKPCSENQTQLYLKISYQRSDKEFAVLNEDQYKPFPEQSKSIEIFGIVGILDLIDNSYVIVTLNCKSVGKISDKEIFKIQKTVPIPLTYEDASTFVDSLKRHAKTESSFIVKPNSLNSPDDSFTQKDKPFDIQKLASVGANFVAKIQSSFRRRSSLNQQSITEDSESDDISRNPEFSGKRPESPRKIETKSRSDSYLSSYFSSSIDKKVLGESLSLFNSGLFYFSPEYNLTRTTQYLKSKSEIIDYWDDLDDRFFWNFHLLKEFIDIRLFGWVYPIIQGFIQVETCCLENIAFDFALISRRSVKRSGLRYERRGIDDDGNTANFVETEHILSFIVEGKLSHILAHVQIRGSVPLYWSQSPTSRKPVPVLDPDREKQLQGLKKHFRDLKSIYGDIYVINLVESSGKESILGQEYEDAIQKSQIDVKFKNFDIHHECKGMKYENIKFLIDAIEENLKGLSYFWKSNEDIFSLQKGVIRTNCMDCLDRTNVTQAAISRHLLSEQLLRNGVHSYPEEGLKYYVEFENLFNNIWANNGDSISIAYTSTSAMKGDVTRTGKRNVQGLVLDGASSVLRMYHNNFRDGYKQKVIEYLLGYNSLDIFVSKDEPEEIDEDQTAEEIIEEYNQAMDAAVNFILTEKAALVFGCIATVMEPSLVRLRGIAVTEKIFLLTKDAYYLVFYDYYFEKITNYKKVLLKDIQKIQKGTMYLDGNRTNPENNYGLIISYSGEDEETRTSTSLFYHADLVKLFQINQTKETQGIKRDILKIPSLNESSRTTVEDLTAKLVTYYCSINASGSIQDDFIKDSDLTNLVTGNSQSNLLHRIISKSFGSKKPDILNK